ncbi:MAG TPA: pilus assembly PilX N-terminal domain-containing protein [candidate division Zixibacteria bacterium]|nr:pilus assembly PilX N-terminal domain-containing protein [candidate division Zixibacteria bacterium]
MDQRGVALPTALIALVVLTALVVAFVTLAGNEPVIASNQLRSAEALALAESGVERAIWALGPYLGPHPGGSPVQPLFNTPRGNATSPWDGSTPLPQAPASDATILGSYTVRLTPGSRSNEVNVESTGWTPDQNAPQGKRIIQVTLQSLSGRFDPPGALNVNGEVDVRGNATVRASGNRCHTATRATASYSAGQTQVGGSAGICLDGNCIRSCTSPNCAQNASDAAQTFQNLRFTQQELDMLKAIARENGTYWGPGQLGPSPGTYNGSVNFTNVPSGVVFIDTRSGNPPSASNPSDLASVRITGDNAAGWIIVMGSLDVAGNTNYSGLIYVVDDLTAGNGTATINGAVIAHNLNNSNGTAIDTSANGNITINYDCAAMDRGGGAVPQGFFVQPGTWRLVSG